VVEHGAKLGIDVQIVARNPADVGFLVQPTRWRVEQTFGILMYFRRLVKDYESNPRTSESRVLWSITAVMGRRLAGPATATWHAPHPAAA
jgi:transposase